MSFICNDDRFQNLPNVLKVEVNKDSIKFRFLNKEDNVHSFFDKEDFDLLQQWNRLINDNIKEDEINLSTFFD
jgi:hypothetical protein